MALETRESSQRTCVLRGASKVVTEKPRLKPRARASATEPRKLAPRVQCPKQGPPGMSEES